MSLCECNVHNSNECDNALFLNERLSDLIIKFPSRNISFPAHRLVMAKTSLYFENLFYGQMAMKDQEWKVTDNDIEPEVFKILLAHCYHLNLLEENVEMTLQIYKLADFYLMDSLKSQCLKLVCDIILKDNDSKWNYQYIIEWSKEYGFNDIENKVFEVLYTKLWGFKNHNQNDQSLLLNLPIETCKKLLSIYKDIDIISFKASWRNPENQLYSEEAMSIFESASQKNEIQFDVQGCFSPQLFKKVVFTGGLYLSLIDKLHSQALNESIKYLTEDYTDLFLVHLHVPCNSMSPNDLAIWESETIASLYLSNVDDQHIQWAITNINSINPGVLYFPKSRLSLNGLKTIVSNIKTREFSLNFVYICSCNMKIENEEVDAWLTENWMINWIEIDICKSDNDIPGW